MQLAATAGATTFQKGLGMIHSLAHPLSALHHTHHGLANALLLPDSIEFIENSILNNEQKGGLAAVLELFDKAGLAKGSLSETCRSWFTALGITFGLRNHNIPEDNLAWIRIISAISQSRWPAAIVRLFSRQRKLLNELQTADRKRTIPDLRIKESRL